MSNRICELREEKKMTQTKLGNLLNVTPAAISKYENNKVALTDTTIIQLTEIFEVTSDYLLGLSQSKVSLDENKENSEANVFTEDELFLLKNFRTLDRQNQLWVVGKTIDLAKETQGKNSNFQDSSLGTKKQA